MRASHRGHWTPLPKLDHWYDKLSQEFQNIDSVIPSMFVEFPSQLLGCASDYSGNQKNSDFHVLSYVWFDPNNIETWMRAVEALRKTLLGPYRTMSFKGLNDVVKKQTLFPFLSAADDLQGVLLSFAIHKNLDEFKIAPDDFEEISRSFPVSTNWGIKSFQDALRAISLFALGATGFSKNADQINWLTDNDVFTEPTARFNHLKTIVAQTLSNWKEEPFDLVVESSKNTSLPKDRAEDILSIPDLVAGSLATILTSHYRSSGTPPLAKSIFAIESSSVDKADNIFDWHCQRDGNLSKVVVILYPPEFGGDRLAVRVIPNYQQNEPFCTLE